MQNIYYDNYRQQLLLPAQIGSKRDQSLMLSPDIKIDIKDLQKIGDLYFQLSAARIVSYDIKRAGKPKGIETSEFSIEQIKQYLKEEAQLYVKERVGINLNLKLAENHRLVFGLLSIDFDSLSHTAFEVQFLKRVEVKGLSLSQFSICSESDDLTQGILNQRQLKGNIGIQAFQSNLSPIRPRQRSRYANNSSQTQFTYLNKSLSKQDEKIEAYFQSIVSYRAQINYFSQFMKIPYVTYQKMNQNNRCYVKSRIVLAEDKNDENVSDCFIFGYGCSSNYKISCEQAAYHILKQIYFTKQRLYEKFIAIKARKKIE